MTTIYTKSAFIEQANQYPEISPKIAPLPPRYDGEMTAPYLANLVASHPDACGLLIALYTQATAPNQVPKERYGDWPVSLTKAGWVININDFEALHNLTKQQVNDIKNFHADVFKIQGYSLLQLSQKAFIDFARFHDTWKNNITSPEMGRATYTASCQSPAVVKLSDNLLGMHPTNNTADYSASHHTVDYRINKKQGYWGSEHADIKAAVVVSALNGPGTLLYPSQVFDVVRVGSYGNLSRGYDVSFKGQMQSVTANQKQFNIPRAPEGTIVFLSDTMIHSVPKYNEERRFIAYGALYSAGQSTTNFSKRMQKGDKTDQILKKLYNYDEEKAKQAEKGLDYKNVFVKNIF